MAVTLQGKYAEHLEIENKQLRQALKEERERNKKAIEYIKNISCQYVDLTIDEDKEKLLEILGDKE